MRRGLLFVVAMLIALALAAAMTPLTAESPAEAQPVDHTPVCTGPAFWIRNDGASTQNVVDVELARFSGEELELLIEYETGTRVAVRAAEPDGRSGRFFAAVRLTSLTFPPGTRADGNATELYRFGPFVYVHFSNQFGQDWSFMAYATACPS